MPLKQMLSLRLVRKREFRDRAEARRSVGQGEQELLSDVNQVGALQAVQSDDQSGILPILKAVRRADFGKPL